MQNEKGDVLGNNFVLRGTNPFLRSEQIVMQLIYGMTCHVVWMGFNSSYGVWLPVVLVGVEVPAVDLVGVQVGGPVPDPGLVGGVGVGAGGAAVGGAVGGEGVVQADGAGGGAGAVVGAQAVDVAAGVLLVVQPAGVVGDLKAVDIPVH